MPTAQSPDPTPVTVLERLLPAIPRGALLYLGSPDPGMLALLAAAGFRPELADVLQARLDRSHAELAATATDAGADAGVGARLLDRSTMALPAAEYTLCVVDILSDLRPDEGDRLLAQVRRATCPGGVVMATARTVADPGFDRQRASGATIARNTFPARDGAVERYLMPGELTMAFAGWLVLHADEGRPGPSPPDAAVRALVVARRPVAGTLLA